MLCKMCVEVCHPLHSNVHLRNSDLCTSTPSLSCVTLICPNKATTIGSNQLGLCLSWKGQCICYVTRMREGGEGSGGEGRGGREG